MADTSKKTKINKVYIVGTVQEVDTQIRKTADGRDYINGKVIVKTIVNGVENVIDVKLLSFALKKDGTSNPVYESYLKLDGFQGKRVKVSAELRDGSLVDQASGKVRHFNEIYLKFINTAKPDEVDCATFEFSGFVTKGLYERKNKEDELLGYKIDVAQANWNDTNISVLSFHVNKEDLNIAQAIETNYLPGCTVKFSGTISSIVTTETKTEEVAFGDPIVKQFTKVERTYRITGGDEPFGEEDPATYTPADIKAFVDAYKTADQKRIDDAAGANEAPVSEAGKAMSNITRSSSLL